MSVTCVLLRKIALKILRKYSHDGGIHLSGCKWNSFPSNQELKRGW